MNAKRILLAVVLSFLVIAAAFYPAARAAAPAEAGFEGSPALVVQVDGKGVPLGISKADVVVRIAAGAAEVRMTLTFKNEMDRALEGELLFPLPDGATVSGYALDINGTMVDGVVVKKDEARVIFEKEVRKGVDPGLAEVAKGNVFRTRIYPIPAKGTRTAMVRYVTAFHRQGRQDIGIPGWDYEAVSLPLQFKDVIPAAHIRIEAAGMKEAPKIAGKAPAGLAFAAEGGLFAAEVSAKDWKPDGEISVVVPGAAAGGAVVEKAESGEFYFSVSDAPIEPKRDVMPAKEARIALFWDTSGSRGKADMKREAGLLEGILKRYEKATVDVVAFSNAPDRAETFVVEKGDASALVARLRALPMDGGTRFAPLATDPAKPPDYALLFSDGVSNGSEKPPEGLNCPVYAFSSCVISDAPFLRFLALKTGGAFFPLSRSTDEDVLKGIGSAPFSFLRATFDPKEISSVEPSVPTPISGSFALAGRLLSDEAKITLHYGVAGKETGSKEFTLSKKGAASTGVVPILWAQRRLDGLLGLPEKNRDEITKTGKTFGLVTPGTSLLVLENLDQYVTYRIPPPKSLPTMRAEWEKRIESQEVQVAKTKEEKLNQVATMWKGRLDWWEREFKYPKDLRVAGEGRPGEDIAPDEVRPESDEPLLMRRANPHLDIAPTPMAPPPPAAPERAFAPAEAPSAKSPSKGHRPSAKKAKGDHGGGGNGGIRAERALANGHDAKNKEDGEESESAPSVQLAPWDPKTPYLDALKEAGPDGAYAAYLKQKEKHGDSPAFYFDCADYLLKNGKRAEGLKALSNVAEQGLDNPGLLRVLAYRLEQEEELEWAARILEEVLRLRPEEPQSYRDLALILGRLKRYDRAMDLLWKVVTDNWDGRFPEIELVALMELNRMIPLAKAAGLKRIPIDPRLEKRLDLDVRIVLQWDADLTDVDLWVTEPSGEKCFYGHADTVIGGHISKDFTQGYGPEDYLLKKTMPGEYVIQANYYGSRQQTLVGPATLRAIVFTNYGRANEERKTLTVRLKDVREIVDIGKIKM